MLNPSERQIHEKYIRRCFQLARLGGKSVGANPNVGAVLVHNGRIIGEGYHEIFGGPHAEVNAVTSVKPEDAKLLSEATLYVSLEPCCIHGKTPACSDLILRSAVPRVVYSAKDPNELVSGQSKILLEKEGVEVIDGILEKEGKDLIRPFHSSLAKWPYVILKWAQSSDGYIGKRGKEIAISNLMTNVKVHLWRREVEGILVGHNTILSDDPLLSVRHVPGESPKRIIMTDTIDELRSCQMMNDESKPIIVGRDNIRGTLTSLFEKGISRLLVEGGANTHKLFIENKCWDEARIITSPYPMGAGVRAARLKGEVVQTEVIQGDIVDYVCPN